MKDQTLTKDYLWNLLNILQNDLLEDLDRWCVWNGDIALDEVNEFKEHANTLIKHFRDLDLQGTLPSDDADEKGGDKQ